MQTVEGLEALESLKQEAEALLILFGGKECNVCHAIKPKLEALLSEHYPKVTQCYVDCHVTTDICAQHGVFTLPTLQVYFGGQRFIEEVRSFSVPKVIEDMARPYSMMFDE
ncbi:thioredoxin family protein [Thiomicrorhabdus sp. zzn3]|uniref:thioredoxin family protein n=1 Tax=Thiomicrorhabdus sp. zzn3 TaxID=3039775 RepID=UPI002437271D|nr:thioredoxin family protein [Thiomicrorhabdus sp. zzn3]MDG6778215.1 thioredoxin family protein [Thiomicrorhabdus sp. zzn3]